MRRLLLKLFRRRRMEHDLEAELAFHREMARTHGDTIPLGNAASLKEESYDLWRFATVENLWRDGVYAVLGLRRAPGLVASALLSLALGVGLNATIFSLAVEFLLSEPSVTDASTLVAVRVGGNSHARPEHLQVLRESGVFADVTGANEETFVNWNDGNETRQVFAVQTTLNYFTALGLPVALGRGYQPSDNSEVVVLRHAFWTRHFQADPSVVGRAMVLNGRPYTIVGVLPENHRTLLGFGFAPDIFLPTFSADTVLAINARLKPEMTRREALAAVETVAARLDTGRADRHKWERGCEVDPVAGWARLRFEKQMKGMGLFFLVLLVAAGLVLLITCVNVASLLMARAVARKRELAIRLALGAGRLRLLQQLMVESLLLACGGAALGLALAQLAARLLARIQLPLPIPIQLQIEPDWRVISYAALLAVFAAVATGLLPAWHTVRESVAQRLHRDSRLRLRRVLVACQIAVSVVVLATGFLFLRNLVRSTSLSPGFDVQRTVRADVYLPRERIAAADRYHLYVSESLRALRALPGIEAAAAARIVPFTDRTVNGGNIRFVDNGEQRRVRFAWNAVSPDFFRAMDIPIRDGRDFAATDRGQLRVAIVNSTFVEQYLGGRRPTGTTILWGPKGETPYQIVGVVDGTRTLTIGEDQMAQLYEPLAQVDPSRTRIQFVMRSATPPATQVAAVKQALRGLEPGAAVDVSSLYSSIGLAFLPSQVGAALLGSMGLLGLLVAMVGLAGTLGYAVTARTREIGIRLTVGATRRTVAGLVLADAARPVALGTVLGLFVAFFVTKPLAIFLVPGIRPDDPLSFAAVVGVLLATSGAAALGPARRAAQVDPLISLRHE